MEIGATNQLHPRPLGEQAAEAAALKWVRNPRQVFPPLLVQQAFTGLDMGLDSINDPEQPR